MPARRDASLSEPLSERREGSLSRRGTQAATEHEQNGGPRRIEPKRLSPAVAGGRQDIRSDGKPCHLHRGHLSHVSGSEELGHFGMRHRYHVDKARRRVDSSSPACGCRPAPCRESPSA